MRLDNIMNIDEYKYNVEVKPAPDLYIYFMEYIFFKFKIKFIPMSAIEFWTRYSKNKTTIIITTPRVSN